MSFFVTREVCRKMCKCFLMRRISNSIQLNSIVKHVLTLTFFTLKISLMLLSMKTTSRSSLSFGRTLLWTTALENALFTANLFSIWTDDSTRSDVSLNL